MSPFGTLGRAVTLYVAQSGLDIKTPKTYETTTGLQPQSQSIYFKMTTFNDLLRRNE